MQGLVDMNLGKFLAVTGLLLSALCMPMQVLAKEKPAKVSYDPYTKTTLISGQAHSHNALLDLDKWDYWLSASITDGIAKNPVLMFSTSTPEWYFFDRAADVDGNELPVIKGGHDVQLGGVAENFGIEMTPKYLADHRTTGFNLKVMGIRQVICNGDDDAFRYLIAWCADMLQSPANGAGVAIVIRGEEGVGKGIFAQVLRRLVSPHSVQITQGQQVTGRFNSILKAKLFVFLDEAFWAGDRQAEGVLKGLITESELVIELKGKEPIRVSNYARILMASNNDWVVPAGHGARRYLVLDASDASKGDSEYFAQLIENINGGGLEAFADHLMKFDVFKVNLRKPPKTKALLEQKLESMESADHFIYERLMDGANGDSLEWQRAVPIDRFYQRYLEAANQVGERWHADRNKLGKRLIKILNVERDRQMVNLQRHYVWVFPPLDVCRQRFGKYMEAEEMGWPESDPTEPPTPPIGSKRRKYG